MLDDFGTGHSSMSTRQRFQLDTLKIDKSFVDNLGSAPESSAIVRAIIGLAGLARPMPADTAETYLREMLIPTAPRSPDRHQICPGESGL